MNVDVDVSSLLHRSPSHTGEVQKMLEEKNVSLSDVEPAPLDEMYVLSLFVFVSPPPSK